MHPADEGEILAGRQVFEQGQVFGKDAHAAFRLKRLPGIEHILSKHKHLAARRRQEPGEHLDRSRLAGTVGPKETVKHPGLNLELDAVHGTKPVKISRQLMGLNRQTHVLVLHAVWLWSPTQPLTS